MADWGNVAISGGYANFANRDYGKVGAEYSYKGDFQNPNIGYKLAAGGDALIGNGHGVNANAYAGVEFNKLGNSQYELGVFADYAQAFKNNAEGNNRPQSLKAGVELGNTIDLCGCDEHKFKYALMGGVERYAAPDDLKGLKKTGGFVGSKFEYNAKLNDKGQELFVNTKAMVGIKSKMNFVGAGIGFKF